MSKKMLLPRNRRLSAKFSSLLLAASAIGVTMTACEAAQPVVAPNHAATRAAPAPAKKVAPVVPAKAGVATATVPAPAASVIKPANPCAPTKPKKKKSGNPCA